MKLLPLLLLASCAAIVDPAETPAECSPPTFAEPNCYEVRCDDYGGAYFNLEEVGCYEPNPTFRCDMPDGSYWDKRPDRLLVHWGWREAEKIHGYTICTVEAK